MKIKIPGFHSVFMDGDPNGGGGGGGNGGSGGGGNGGSGGGNGGSGGGGGGGGTQWYDEFKDANLKTWVSSFNGAYGDPEAMTAKAYNLEKLMGAEKAGRSVIIPKEDAKPEEFQAFWRKLGAAESVDGYKLDDSFKDDKMATEFRAFAHANNIPVGMFQAVMKFAQDFSKKHVEESAAIMGANSEKEIGTLRTEWGKDYDKNIELGRRFAKDAFDDASPEEVQSMLTSIEAAIGPRRMLRLFAKAGGGMSEMPFVSNDGGGTGGGTITPESARAQINELKKDKEFQQKVFNKDAAAVARWNNLHAIGYGG